MLLFEEFYPTIELFGNIVVVQLAELIIVKSWEIQFDSLHCGIISILIILSTLYDVRGEGNMSIHYAAHPLQCPSGSGLKLSGKKNSSVNWHLSTLYHRRTLNRVFVIFF